MNYLDKERLSQPMIDEGNEAAAHLFDAHIEKCLGGTGGCKHFELETYPARFHDLITVYVENKMDFVEAIYIAMRRHNIPQNDTVLPADIPTKTMPDHDTVDAQPVRTTVQPRINHG